MSTLNVGNITDGTNSVATEKLSKGTAAAWVNFDGTTNAIRSSFNVSSITDLGTGEYTINYTSALASSSYLALSNSGYDDGTYEEPRNSSCFQQTTNSIKVRTGYSAFTTQDEHRVEVAVFT